MSIQRKWKIRIQFGTQTTIVVFVLIAFCASIFPVSLPAPLNSSGQSTEAYPCQKCACGCKSAEHCWLNCCCHTHQEKMEWAEEHGVSPPDYFLELLTFEQGAAELFSEKLICVEPAGEGGCCDSSQEKKCCSSTNIVCDIETANDSELMVYSDKHQSCCDKFCTEESTKTTNTHLEDPSNSEQNSPQYVIRALALKCQGQSSALHLLPWIAISKPPTVSFSEQASSRCYPVSSHFSSRTLEPPVPPPKIFS